MNKLFMVLILLSFSFAGCAQESKKDVTLETQEQKASYAIGNNIGKNFLTQDMNISIDEFVAGIIDGMEGNSKMTEEEISKVLATYQQEMMAKQKAKLAEEGKVHKEEGDKFLAENKTKPGVVTLPSGLQYKIIKEGNGPKPQSDDRVKVHYKGSFIDGQEFDSSYKRNQPATFPVTGVIKGWIEALQLMPVGSKWELYIPYDLAYGERGKQPTIPPYKTLLFTVELLEIEK